MGKRRNARRNKMKSDRSIRRGLHETRRGISSCPNEFLSSVEKPRGPRLVFRLFLLPVSQTRPKLSANHAGFYRFAQQHTKQRSNEDDKRLTRLLPNEFLCFILNDVILPLISLRTTYNDRTCRFLRVYATFTRHLCDI